VPFFAAALGVAMYVCYSSYIPHYTELQAHAKFGQISNNVWLSVTYSFLLLSFPENAAEVLESLQGKSSQNGETINLFS
jgi:SNF family Na+-dependent transporter